MTYEQLMIAHLATVVPCFFFGIAIFAMRKGTRIHRMTGCVYVLLMILISCISIFMRARAGPLFLGHFGFIHIFSVMTLVSLPIAILAARNGRVKIHKLLMVSAYIGAILFAGLLTLMPDRYLHRLLFSH